MRFFLVIFACAFNLACTNDTQKKTTNDIGSTEDSDLDTVDSAGLVDTAAPSDSGSTNNTAASLDMQRVDTASDALPDVHPDVAPDARPDILLLDASPPGPLDMGAECIAAGSPHACGRHRNCIDGRCRVDLRPNYYRVVDVDLIQPADAEPLRGLLEYAVAEDVINLLLEPGSYTADEQYLWYVGAGWALRDNAGELDDHSYVFNHYAPIFNIVGNWFEHEDGRPLFIQNSVERLELFRVIERTIEVEGPSGRPRRVECMASVGLSARIELWPAHLDYEERSHLFGHVTGVIHEEDVRTTVFPLFGASIRLADFFEGVPVDVDTNNDGEPDAYAFELVTTAEPVIFVDPDPRRDPNANRSNHPACEETP